METKVLQEVIEILKNSLQRLENLESTNHDVIIGIDELNESIIHLEDAIEKT